MNIVLLPCKRASINVCNFLSHLVTQSTLLIVYFVICRFGSKIEELNGANQKRKTLQHNRMSLNLEVPPTLQVQ